MITSVGGEISLAWSVVGYKEGGGLNFALSGYKIKTGASN